MFVLGLYLYFIYKYHKDLLVFIVVLTLIYQGRIAIFHFWSISQEKTHQIEVIKDIKYGYTTSFIGRINQTYVMVYLPTNHQVEYGDIFLITGDVQSFSDATIPLGFSPYDYYVSKRIKHLYLVDNYSFIRSSFSINKLAFHLNNYIENRMPKSKAYIKTFVLADKEDLDQEFYKEVSFLGISHLFAVSGLHISLLVFAIKKITKYSTLIIMVALPIYMVITNFSPSVVRASLLFILYGYIKYKKIPLSILDIISILFIGFLVVNPYIYFNKGFVLSFLVTTSIVVSQYMFVNKSYLNQVFLISLIAFLSTLPIIVNLSYSINLISIFVNVLMVTLMSFLVLPFGYLVFLFPVLDSVYVYLISWFEDLIYLFSKLDFLVYQGYFTWWISLLYYYGLYLVLVGKKKQGPLIGLFVVFLLGMYSSYLNPVSEVSVIDVYGDSILVKTGFNQCNVLIDTGPDDDYDQVISYIKRKQIRHLDYLFITHYHSDHMGELEDILKHFSVGKIIDYTNAPDQLECGGLSFMFYPSFTSYDENNSSLVFKMTLYKDTYLFTGDIEHIREQELLKYFNLDTDYLKLGHHGSITSSSQAFLDHTSPHTVFVTSHRRNTHNHPSEQVINRLEDKNIEIYRIDHDGTIVITYVFGNTLKNTTPP